MAKAATKESDITRTRQIHLGPWNRSFSVWNRTEGILYTPTPPRTTPTIDVGDVDSAEAAGFTEFDAYQSDWFLENYGPPYHLFVRSSKSKSTEQSTEL
ncbi:hypothetical protein E4U55_006359 [Claviceps digitariae]|nr:hypothetical protein E4U55_006359 [Claviceps digitariae]